MQSCSWTISGPGGAPHPRQTVAGKQPAAISQGMTTHYARRHPRGGREDEELVARRAVVGTMNLLGWIHIASALVALGAGAAVLRRRKGTRWHRRMGWVYAAGMILLNATAL